MSRRWEEVGIKLVKSGTPGLVDCHEVASAQADAMPLVVPAACSRSRPMHLARTRARTAENCPRRRHRRDASDVTARGHGRPHGRADQVCAHRQKPRLAMDLAVDDPSTAENQPASDAYDEAGNESAALSCHHETAGQTKKSKKPGPSGPGFFFGVAGTGFEPVTSGL